MYSKNQEREKTKNVKEKNRKFEKYSARIMFRNIPNNKIKHKEEEAI